MELQTSHQKRPISAPNALATLRHQGNKATEMMVSVVGARAGLWVILNAKDRLLTHRQSCHRSIVEVEMGDLHPITWKGSRIKGKAMVLAGDFDLAWRAAGMVEAAMAIAQFEAGSAKGQAQNLMAKTNAEDRQIGLLQQTCSQGNALGDGSRIARAIGKKHPLRLMGQHLLQAAV